MIRHPLSRLIRAWLSTAVIDGLFSSVLSVAFYGSTATRLFQGVASTLLGKEALNGGTSTALVGLLMHFGVALGWSSVFLLLAMRSSWLRRILATPSGVLRVASVYGPCIWMVMSLVFVPLLLNRPPTFNIRWWVQFFGHIPFVALPIVWSIAGGLDPIETSQGLLSGRINMIEREFREVCEWGELLLLQSSIASDELGRNSLESQQILFDAETAENNAMLVSIKERWHDNYDAVLRVKKEKLCS